MKHTYSASCLLLVLLALPAAPQNPPLRIGVFGLYRPVELLVRPFQGSVLQLEAGGEVFVLEGGQSASLRLRQDGIECQAQNRTVVASLVRVTSRSGLDTDFILTVPAKRDRHFRGRLEVEVEDGSLVPVVLMERETAVASVVAAESPSQALPEALKAQAVVARSYYAAARGRHSGFDFCDSTHCQHLRVPPVAGTRAATATVATRGLVLAHRGKTIPALYSASCGGRTQTRADIGMQPDGYPYFSVDCAYCREHAPRWESHLQGKLANALLASHRSEAVRVAIGRRLGFKTVPGNNYSVHREGSGVVVRGLGVGHGAGLCQQGAAAMAREGADFGTILQHYFPNTTLIADN